MSVISVTGLKKTYQIHKKEPGFAGSLKSLVNRKYIDVNAVDGVDFTIDEGELVGFIGPNGAGKTTTLKVLSGLLYPTAGQVSVLGFTPWERKTEFQMQFSLVMGQKNQLWWDLPALESFILNKEIYEIPEKEFRNTLDNLVELLDVRDLLKVQVRKLSLGQRMKMELIAALIHSPKILFLDEPTIGLDVVMQKKMRDFIKEYNRSSKSTIILTSHYMEDVKELCQRIIVIDKGRILYDGLLSEIVSKFASQKTITATFNKSVTKAELAKIGTIKEFEYPRAVFSVKRSAVADSAAKLLQNFPVADLDIEEPSIEEVIREVFSGRK
jgi:ABC-2 type transport system ATP-binding protein